MVLPWYNNCLSILFFVAAPVAQVLSLQPSAIQGIVRTPPRLVRSGHEEVWSGADGVATNHDLINLPRTASLDIDAQLQIAGMYDTGTNLLGALLEANLGRNDMERVCPGIHDYHCHWWKHVAPDELDKQLDSSSSRGQNIILVAMVRSPLAHIASWIKAPYDIEYCVSGMDLKHDNETVCELPSLFGGGTFKGLTGVWNDFVRGYHEQALRSDRKVILVEYEKLVYDPEPVIQEIADALGITLNTAFQTVDDAAKEDHGAHGREEALAEIRDMGYLHRPPLDELSVREALCRNLDDSLMLVHGFTLPDLNENRTYVADCRA